MIEAALGDRVVVGPARGGLTGAQLASRARRGAAWLSRTRSAGVIYVRRQRRGPSRRPVRGGRRRRAVHPDQLPAQRRAARRADRAQPRLGRDRRPAVATRCSPRADRVLTLGEWAEITGGDDVEIDPASTTRTRSPWCSTRAAPRRQPKAALLRHRHLTVLRARHRPSLAERRRGRRRARVGAAVPHRRRGQPADQPLRRPPHRLPRRLRPRGLARRRCDQEGITHAMVVPTMLARIVDALERAPADAPTAAHARLRRRPDAADRCSSGRCALFPDAGFVNAYGLTETSSTIAVLGPDDHRAALAPTTRPSAPASARRAGRCRASRSRSATSSASSSRRARRASLAARRAGVRRVRDRARSLDADGWFPHQGPRLASTTTATSSSRAAPTTPSSAAARTSPRPRSRTSLVRPPGGRRRRAWSASPTTSGASASPPSSC